MLLFRFACLWLCASLASAAGAPGARWVSAGRPTAQALALIDALLHAQDHGLRASQYGAAGLQAEAGRAPLDAAAAQQLESRLNAAALRFATDLQRGQVRPSAGGYTLAPVRAALDAEAVLDRLSRARDVSVEIRALEPAFLHYRLLQQWLVRYRALAQQQPALTQLPRLPRRSVHAGESYAGAGALRALLMALGDMPAATASTASGDSYDAALVSAIVHFQERHGITADGVLGASTFAALTTPLSRRIEQIELTLERWRWLPPFDTPPIIVNIPQFRLFAFRTTDDRYDDILQMPVIVGESNPSKRTPIFMADMTQVVFRPYWDVPASILRNEMLGPILADRRYLERHQLELVAGPGDDSPVVAPTDENIARLGRGELRLRQRPGPDNSLGLIKFVFPNEFGVYLHGTPAVELFRRARRDFSHGCIRLSDPAGLAVHVLRNEASNWDRATIEQAMQGRASNRVPLGKPVRVMVLYGTALATEDGRILFFDDIYGHDRRLARALAARVRAPAS